MPYIRYEGTFRLSENLLGQKLDALSRATGIPREAFSATSTEAAISPEGLVVTVFATPKDISTKKAIADIILDGSYGENVHNLAFVDSVPLDDWYFKGKSWAEIISEKD